MEQNLKNKQYNVALDAPVQKHNYVTADICTMIVKLYKTLRFLKKTQKCINEKSKKEHCMNTLKQTTQRNDTTTVGNIK